MSKLTSEGYVGLYHEPDDVENYVQLADGKWYHKAIAREVVMARAAEEVRKECEEDHLPAVLSNEPCVECGEDAWVDASEQPMNPKYIRAQKEGKVPLECLITGVLASEARVLKHGADKYGARNWRKDAILASTYEGAMMRHLFAWIEGEDIDPDSGEPHLSHLRACCAVVLDGQAHGKLIDDRGRMESKAQ